MKNIWFFLVALLIVNTTNAQWIQTKGPCNGSINCIAQSGDNIYAGIAGGGIYVSTDNGYNWNAINNGLTNLHVSSIVMKDNNIFAGTIGGGMFLSTDNGSHWKAINNGMPPINNHILSLTTCGENIYAGTGGNGMYMSADNGQNWKVINNGLTDNVIWSLGNNGSCVIAGTQAAGPFISTDNGATWTPISNGLPKGALYVSAIAFKGGDIFIGTGAGIYRTSDKGKTWRALNAGISGYGIYINEFLFDGDNIYAGTNDGVYFSNNNGESWTRHVTGFVYAYTIVSALAIKDDNIFAGTESTGMFLSTDNGMTWEPKNSGIIHSYITSLVVKDGNIFAGNHANGVFKSSDDGESWTAVNNGLWNKDVAALAVIDDHLFAGAGCGGIFLSTDNGESWESKSNGLTTKCISSLVVDGNNIYTGTQGGVFLSVDMANSWTSISQGLPASTWDIKLAASGNNLYAGIGNSIYLSTNKGESWSMINSEMAKPIFAMAASGDYIFAGTQGDGIYVSSNNGKTWEQANNGLANGNINNFYKSGSNIYVATGGGVFLSKDNGLNWISMNEGWDDKLVTSLAISSGYLYAGTGEGVWKRSINEGAKIWISGVITDSSGEAVKGVTLQGLPGNPKTNDNGFYSDSVFVGWSGKITPLLNGYTFTPLSRSYSTINENQVDQDFSGEFKSVHSISVSTTSITLTQNSGVSSKNPTFTFADNSQTNSNSTGISQQTLVNEHKMGCIVPDSVVEYWKNHQPAAVVHLKSYTPTIDWSNNDSPVKDQGACGSCWAFATCAYIENIGTQADLSEQALLSCAGSGSCEGGYYDKAMQFAQSEGIPDESCYSYTQTTGTCNNMCENPNFKEKIRTVSNELWGIATVDLLKSELQNGPLIVTMQVPFDNTFDNYTGGVYHYNGGIIPEGRAHAVLLVGYDDTQKCFKVKNSWGAGWGEYGYFRISYDDVSNEVQFGSYAIKGSEAYTENLSNSTFTISAIGNDNLIIESISSNKGWLTTSVYPENSLTLSPSTSKSITVSVHWEKMGAMTETGTISIQSNDPDKPLVTIQVTAIPLCANSMNASITVDGNTTFCMGDYAVLNANTGDNLIYQWKKNGVIIPDANGSSYIVISGGAYSVEVSQIGTTCVAESSPVAMVVNPTPQEPTISLVGKNLMSNRSKGNQWYDQNGLIAGATSQYYLPIEEGDFYVVSAINGCSSLPSNTIHYGVTDINTVAFGKSISIRPNPFSNELVIESLSYDGKVAFEIINTIGQIVSKGDFIKNIRLNTRSLSPGTYIIRLLNGKTTEFRKIIKK